MSFSYNIIKKDSHLTSQWSGGTTTELAIYPKDSTYSNRDFLWRLSSANVELLNSDFTLLPDYNRILMVLEGSLELIHENQYTKTLNTFEQDSFSGGWITHSVGSVIDFNLMLGANAFGKLDAINIAPNGQISMILDDFGISDTSNICHAFYALNDNINAIVQNSEFDLEKGDLLIIYMDNFTNYPISFKSSINSNVIHAYIAY